MSADRAAVELELVDRIERAGIHGWPPRFVEELADGWILRATPGANGGRANHALTPRTRTLAAGELPPALERVRAWSARHGIRGGLQISPLERHGKVIPGLVAAGWEPIWKCWVMAADRSEVIDRGALAFGAERDGALPWVSGHRADDAWLAARAACQPNADRQSIDALVATVFPRMGERGVFGRLGEAASGIVVEDELGEWAGLFSLVVAPKLRGRGLGRRLVLSLLEDVQAPQVYLQVTMDNSVALALYESLGFRAVHSYQHLLAPHGWAANG